MNALFIFPKDTILFGVPLGIANLAACVRQAGYGVKILDLRYEPETKLKQELSKHDYKLIGIYSSSEIANVTCAIAKEVQQLNPEAFLVVGGPHATLDPEFFLEKGVDVILKGESEHTIVELCQIINKVKDKKKEYSVLEKVKGIIWKKPTGEVITNPPQPYIEDLDSLPFPAYDLFPNLKESFRVNYTWTNLQPFTHVLTSRGCPYQCTFCQPVLFNMFGKTIRRMSAKRVFELLSWLKDEYKIKEVFFQDDLLFHYSWKNWLFEWQSLVKKNDLDIRWWGQSRANSSTKEMLEKAHSAGCYMVMVGCESGSQKILDYYNKQIKVQDIENMFATCKEVGLMTIAEIIFGAPIETTEDAQKTVELIKKIKPDNVFTTILTAYPGTYLYDKLKKDNVEFEKNFDKISRAVPTQKIQSLLTENQIHEFQTSIIQPNPSIKYILTRQYYRKTYTLKIKNLIEQKEFKKLGNLLLLTATDPAIIKMRPVYRKYRETNIMKAIGNLYRSIKTHA
ncbi:MAG: cobalamin B12-binding domain-containing protein [Candidatus Aenigmarchaeota archaeon]|nr:cobalamin B12-binding domain-containing protein [Candidatus Aenigmarchaeota archaeon]